MSGRHAAPKNGKEHDGRSRTVTILAATGSILIALGGTAWMLPGSMIPLPKTSMECTVTSGGTLRIHTSDCGTLYYRGHIDLTAGQRYDITATGPIAWTIRPA